MISPITIIKIYLQLILTALQINVLSLKTVESSFKKSQFCYLLKTENVGISLNTAPATLNSIAGSQELTFCSGGKVLWVMIQCSLANNIELSHPQGENSVGRSCMLHTC
jgi:hypothetical protein